MGALVAAGASVRRIAMRPWRSAVLPYLATLQAGSEGSTADLLAEAGERRPAWRDLLRRGGAHTVPMRLALLAEMLPDSGDSAARQRLLAAGRSIASELIEAIGDGVLLHPAHPRPAPRHATDGRSDSRGCSRRRRCSTSPASR